MKTEYITMEVKVKIYYHEPKYKKEAIAKAKKVCTGKYITNGFSSAESLTAKLKKD